MRRTPRVRAALSATALTVALTGALDGGAVAAATAALPAVHPFATRAPESQFTAAGASAGTVACQRPAPDNRVSTTIHCYGPDQMRAAYGLGPLRTATEGAGQTIVLVDAYGSPTAAQDVAFFAKTFGGPVPDFETYFPLGSPDYSNAGNGSGTSGPTAADGWAGEANLDVQWAYAIAPKAHIVLLATPPAETQGVQGLPNLMKAIDAAVVKYPSGTVFSMSFGTDEAAFGGQSAAKSQFDRFDATFQRGLAKQDTFFASAGDDGSVGVTRAQHQTAPSDTPQVSYPNVSPYVTSVGGTQLQYHWNWTPTTDQPFTATGARNPDYFAFTTTTSKTEAVWNESWASVATGGGKSSVYPRPAFQDGVAGVVGTQRGVPDISWNAAINGGALVYRSYFQDLEGPPSWAVFGGTSASSPQVAALTAQVNAARKAHGKAPIGDLNQVLYSLKGAGSADIGPRTYGTAASGKLVDNQLWDLGADGTVVKDPVAGYPTTKGYDLTTGWGVPLGATWSKGFLAN